MMNKTYLTENLNLLGLSDKEAKIYLSLLKQGILTPLELSRITKINRTTIYRVLEQLKDKGLAEEILDQHRIKARAVDPESLKLLIAQRETQLKKLKKGLPEIISRLTTVKDTPSASTKVVYFRGRQGLQQMLWNVLKGKNEFVGYGYGDWNKSVGKEFAEKLRQKKADENIFSREIQNKDQVDANKTYTQVKGYKKVHQCRAIPKSIIEINHDTYIYNDVFAFYHFYEGELFGVEIHNQEIAKTQRQIFEVLWKMAKSKTKSK